MHTYTHAHTHTHMHARKHTHTHSLTSLSTNLPEPLDGRRRSYRPSRYVRPGSRLEGRLGGCRYVNRKPSLSALKATPSCGADGRRWCPRRASRQWKRTRSFPPTPCECRTQRNSLSSLEQRCPIIYIPYKEGEEN